MSLTKKSTILCLLLISYLPFITFSATSANNHSLAYDSLAKTLGWVESDENNCGGYYLEEPFTYSNDLASNSIEIRGNEGLLSQHGTSILEGQVTISRAGQQMTARKAYLYRDPSTGKLSAVEMIGDVHFREPNTLIVARKGRYNFVTKTKTLMDLLYRTSLSGRQILGPNVSEEEIREPRKITTLTAWGEAHEFSQAEPKVFEFSQSSFTTCPPINPAWQVQAGHIVLNKNTGRGYATNVRFLVKNMPIFYTPYISFPIDKRRKTGFLWPILGVSGKWGPYFLTPFYWNMAPNYDMTITPGILSKRGVQLSDRFRYLTHTSSGMTNLSVLPNDRYFANFQKRTIEDPAYANSKDPVVQAELNRLSRYNDTRKSFFWRDDSRFNKHWSSHIDFNYAGDDYYMQDFGSNLNEITKNQLLQEGDLYFQSENWNFIGRLQTYQTLHPVIDAPVTNQYRRFPQLILTGDYPDQPFGLEYFINNDIAHFEILKTPGSNTILPVGNRFHTQPGINLPLYWPYFFINPRIQLALTDYSLHQTSFTHAPNSKRRTVPIFDVASGLAFNRDVSIFGRAFDQTLEPQIYYTYIPYRNQASIPIFDTTVNTLTYDQIFNYNRFSGLDRIGDANQLGFGVTTRLIDRETGIEKMRFGIGDIIYFANRRVTLCNSENVCTDNPFNPSNHWRLSPISSMLNLNLIDFWSLMTNVIWNPISKQLDNTTIGLHFQREQRIFNLGYTYARNGDILSGIQTPESENNLKVSDFSFAWPVFRDISLVGRWSQNWNRRHLQNLLYGLQYDTCCWAFRMVGGRAFTGIDTNKNNQPQYNTEFYIQFALKGLGNVGRDPSGILSSINGYNTQFGQEF